MLGERGVRLESIDLHCTSPFLLQHQSLPFLQGNVSAVGAGVSAAATAALTAVMSSPAMALVDDRMSTEGTGLPFGLSNNLLGWILLGVFGLIWTFYFTYTSSLDEDEESGLSL
uniref:PSII 6.1 kDa protein n=1 Tax=Brassica oleracea var. oleracea TaxID=109376 RepID=A0A0D3BTI0_BRAOL